MKVTQNGRVTIPKHLRNALDISDDTEIEFERRGDAILIRKVADVRRHGGPLIQRLRGRGDTAMTTDEIMALTRTT